MPADASASAAEVRPHEGRVAVVTGGARGIGLCYARALGAEGATVVLADIDESAAAVAAKELVGEGLSAVGRGLDVRDEASTRELASHVRDVFGGCHILVNNAAIYHSMRRDGAMDVDIEYWRQVMAVNLDGPLLVTQALAPLMIEAGWGRIVNQSSTAAYTGARAAHYAVSKLGLVALTQAFARELGPHGITVNAIAPGMILTEATTSLLNDEQRAASVNTQAIPRQGVPSDLIGALRYLCSDSAGWTSGQVLVVDGFKTPRI